MSLIWLIDGPDSARSPSPPPSCPLNRLDLPADLLGGLAVCLAIPSLVGYQREALAGFTGSGRFDGRMRAADSFLCAIEVIT
jgi:hypothetical protein